MIKTKNEEKKLILLKNWDNKSIKNFLDCFISMESIFPAIIAWLLYMIMNFVYMFWMHVNWAINFILWNIDLANYQMDYYNFFLSDISSIYKFWFCLLAFCFIISQILLIQKKKFSILSFLIYLWIYGYMIYCLWWYSMHLNLFLF